MVNEHQLCEIGASTKWYAKDVRRTPMDRGLKEAQDFLAVPFDEGCRFCVMKKSTYREKHENELKSDQF